MFVSLCWFVFFFLNFGHHGSYNIYPHKKYFYLYENQVFINSSNG